MSKYTIPGSLIVPDAISSPTIASYSAAVSTSPGGPAVGQRDQTS